jgi:adenosylcobinamide kinase/adenosylcobinamide-phosphate guanylyltransferase
MKVLYFGGQKCGKSVLAEQKACALSNTPFYIATYDNSYKDEAMQNRINKHQKHRGNFFTTIEEPKDLTEVIHVGNTYLIDCISMWIFNNLEKSEEELIAQLDTICQRDASLVFVLNDVNCGVIPFDAQSRKFVDLSGIIGQRLAKWCDEVYEVKYGLEIQRK